MGRKDGKEGFAGVSDAELSVLKLLWSEGPGAPNELQERLSGEGIDWAYTTVQTLLHRLLKKGYVARERAGVARVYRATVDREELLARHMNDLAERMCEGAATPLLLGLVRSQKFSRKELSRFREILDAESGKPRAKRRRRKE